MAVQYVQLSLLYFFRRGLPGEECACGGSFGGSAALGHCRTGEVLTYSLCHTLRAGLALTKQARAQGNLQKWVKIKYYSKDSGWG